MGVFPNMGTRSYRSAFLFSGIAFGFALIFVFGYFEPSMKDLSEQSPQQPDKKAIPNTATTVTEKASCETTFPVSPRVRAALRQGAPLRIGIFGDSFADGIWGAARTKFDRDPTFQVIRFSKAATGFTTYHISDRYEDARQKLAAQPVDIALISFGANDAQAIMVADKVAPYMSATWKKVIGDRASAFVRLLTDQGVAVAWVGLPGMRSPKFDRKAHLMTGFFKDMACREQIAFLDPAKETEGPDHLYLNELRDPKSGKIYAARADDGIHMSMAGYRMIAAPIFAQIAELKARPGPPPADGKR